jgi:hypothetical protein
MKEIKVDPKLVADQQGHGVGLNQNEYTQTSVASRLAAAIYDIDIAIGIA